MKCHTALPVLLQSPDGLPGRAAVKLELQLLRVWGRQLQLRLQLEREGEELLLLPERNYKQMQKMMAK